MAKGWFFLFMIGSSALLAGGCGASKTGDVRQLQTQLTMLDERVTQLERTTTTAGPASEAFAVPETVQLPMVTEPAAGAAGDESGAWTRPKTEDVQLSLKNAGFYQGEVDGKMGPQTRAAIREFQRVHGLSVDGVVGQRTWMKLNQYLAGAPAAGIDTEIK